MEAADTCERGARRWRECAALRRSKEDAGQPDGGAAAAARPLDGARGTRVARRAAAGGAQGEGGGVSRRRHPGGSARGRDAEGGGLRWRTPPGRAQSTSTCSSRPSTAARGSPSRSSRDTIDPSTQIKPFEEKVRRGVQEGLFESAVFLSLRAPTKKSSASSVHLEMFDDEARRPLVPVSYLGPERGKVVFALLAEQVETHVSLHAALAVQCHALRRTAVRGDGDRPSSRTSSTPRPRRSRARSRTSRSSRSCDGPPEQPHPHALEDGRPVPRALGAQQGGRVPGALALFRGCLVRDAAGQGGHHDGRQGLERALQEKQAQVERDIGQKAVFASVKRARRRLILPVPHVLRDAIR